MLDKELVFDKKNWCLITSRCLLKGLYFDKMLMFEFLFVYDLILVSD